jgi:hypothetical protein
MNMLKAGLSGAYPKEAAFYAGYDEWGNAGSAGWLSSLFVDGPTLKIGPFGDSQVAISASTNDASAAQGWVLQQSSGIAGPWKMVSNAPQVGTAYTYLGSKSTVQLSVRPGGTNWTCILDKPATSGYYRVWNTNYPDVK